MSARDSFASTIPGGRRGVAVATIGLACTALLLGCGGGTDVAPPDPVVEGFGFAQGTLAGIDLGPAELVTAGITSTTPRATMVTDESVTLSGDIGVLAHSSVDPGSIVVTAAAGTPTYVLGDDYTADALTGVLTRVPTGSIPAGATLLVDYRYTARLACINVGIGFPAGHQVLLSAYNLDQGMAVPTTVTATAGSCPGSGSLAFRVSGSANLTVFEGLQSYEIVDACSTDTDPVNCPIMNRLVIEAVDVSNTLNPCLSGHVQATVTDTRSPDPVDRWVLDLDFDDPDC